MATILFTRQGREVIRALANLNDQYSLFLFLEYQFHEQLQDLDKSALGQYTSQAFHRNPFGPRIHVRIGKLQPFLEANRGASLGAYLSTSYEVASAFVDKAVELLRETNLPSVKFPGKQREGPEQYYRRVLVASGYSLPEQELTDTIAFIRYRRNAIVHLSAAPAPAYRAMSKTAGPGLNSYWKSSKVQIDFTDPRVGPPSERETLDLLKLLRIVTQLLDAHLATLIDVPGLINSVADRAFGGEKVRLNLLVHEKRIRKLRSLLGREFGFSGSTGDLDSALKTTGIR